MVHRMIGTRIGTGGSTGQDYLRSALNSHHLFKEIAWLTSFLIERRKLPALSPEMERRLGFLADDRPVDCPTVLAKTRGIQHPICLSDDDDIMTIR